MNTQSLRYQHDRSIWDQCATTYERQIVRGHPDVTAYESFEHSFIEKLVLFLTRDRSLTIDCYDFGCGSGRIHTLLAPFLFTAVSESKTQNSLSSGKLVHVGGIDFSKQMIELAKQNLTSSGLDTLYPEYLSFDIGSAFDVAPYTGPHTPLAVSVCNSIGVMQGEEGARNLFRTMHDYIKERKGIALISCYCLEAVESFALGNYESTMDVSGQPCWLTPETYTGNDCTLLPNYYKRAHDKDPNIIIDVIDSENKCIERNFKLTRDPDKVKKVIQTGQIDTFNGYRSLWYSTKQIRYWMKELWTGGTLWHIPGIQLDRLRGEPAQLAVIDYNGAFEALARTWNLRPLSR